MSASTDQHWTRFVRAWRAIGTARLGQWLRSSERAALLLKTHPLPWRIEQDWTWEVIASDSTCVAKCKTYAEAEAFVAVAEALP